MWVLILVRNRFEAHDLIIRLMLEFARFRCLAIFLHVLLPLESTYLTVWIGGKNNDYYPTVLN